MSSRRTSTTVIRQAACGSRARGQTPLAGPDIRFAPPWPRSLAGARVVPGCMAAEGRDARFRLVVDTERLVHPDLELVQVLARLRLVTRRLGGTLQIRNAGEDLRRLVELAGLTDVLGLSGEALGQAEGGEELGVEKVVQPGDPPT